MKRATASVTRAQQELIGRRRRAEQVERVWTASFRRTTTSSLSDVPSRADAACIGQSGEPSAMVLRGKVKPSSPLHHALRHLPRQLTARLCQLPGVHVRRSPLGSVDIVSVQKGTAGSGASRSLSTLGPLITAIEFG
jgi:hypothetical protein